MSEQIGRDLVMGCISTYYFFQSNPNESVKGDKTVYKLAKEKGQDINPLFLVPTNRS